MFESRPCLTFLHCALSNVSSNYLPLRSHIGCIISTFPMHYAKVVMGRWKYELFNFEREIYLEYLDTDKMVGKVEKSI